ncbi:F-box/LRR-repeat protein 25-like [Solanum tuberosum]|uniref:F-box family protein n=1 Tax=Solanum tuberosum TaxID=4113 RepID=M1DQU9_SOLTU|nr:PREDICTED: F-box/LRR-repeat protein 25-like [Solanum tuberosum]
MAKREDRTSELPVHIIHHILCRTNLEVKEAAATYMLSKRWYYCWTSRPNLILHQFQGNTYMPLEKFVKLVDQSLRFHVEHNLHLEKLKLTYSDRDLDSKVDHWIELGVKLNVTVLVIYPSFLSKSYSLPNVIYDAKKLKTLWLSRCKFEFDISTTHIRFCCLEDLYLYYVHISDAQLQRVIDRCPFIKTLDLVSCQGISKLHVFGLVYLKNLTVVLCKLNRVIVQVQNLQFFRYVEVPDHPCEIAILDGYNTLQTLKLTGASITDQQFRDVPKHFRIGSNIML